MVYYDELQFSDLNNMIRSRSFMQPEIIFTSSKTIQREILVFIGLNNVIRYRLFVLHSPFWDFDDIPQYDAMGIVDIKGLI